jgi:hypothetical protein
MRSVVLAVAQLSSRWQVVSRTGVIALDAQLRRAMGHCLSNVGTLPDGQPDTWLMGRNRLRESLSGLAHVAAGIHSR